MPLSWCYKPHMIPSQREIIPLSSTGDAPKFSKCFTTILSLNLNEPIGERHDFPLEKNNNQNQAASREWSSHFLLDSWTALYGTRKKSMWLAQNTPFSNNSLICHARDETRQEQLPKILSLCYFPVLTHSTCTSCWLQHRQLNFPSGAMPNGAVLCSSRMNSHWHLFQCSLHLNKVYIINSSIA